MSTLTRYLLLELLKVFGVVLAVLTPMMLFFAVTQNILPKDLGATQVAKIIPYILPDALRQGIQGATLYSVCAVFGRMAANNELVAARSLGISPMVFIRPALCLAAMASMACVWLWNLDASWGGQGLRRVVIESVEAIAYSTLTAKHSYKTPHLSINVKRVDGRRLVRPTFLYQPPDGGQPMTITAEEGYLRTDPRDKTLTILFCNGSVHTADEMRLLFPETFEHVVPLSRASRDFSDPDWQAETCAFLGKQIERHQLRILQLKAALRTARQKHSPNHVIGHLRQDMQTERQKIARCQVSYQCRFANGFICLAFAMIGIPVSILLRSGETIKSFVVCFLPIVAVNHPLWILSNKLARTGEASAYWLWLGDLVLMGAGVWMLRKAIRH